MGIIVKKKKKNSYRVYVHSFHTEQWSQWTEGLFCIEKETLNNLHHQVVYSVTQKYTVNPDYGFDSQRKTPVYYKLGTNFRVLAIIADSLSPMGQE